ncbi:large subunit of alpha-aminoadipate reductase [Pseudocyphellaria aurata]|nr:large subunit of alpha-aminoadipate reductase [Pseudocyphellaria aurata]
MALLERWSSRLSNLTVSPLTRDYPEPSQSAPESARRPIEACETLEVSFDVHNALKKYRRDGDKHDWSFSVFLSAVVVLVCRLTGDENIAVGTNKTTGIPFVLRTAVDLNEEFAKLLARVEQLYLEFGADAIPLEKIREHLKQPSLYRFAVYPVPKGSSQDALPRDPSTPDVTIYVDDDSESSITNGINESADHSDLPKIRAIYNQRLFSSSRISFILAQLLQIIQVASLNPEEPIGKIDLMTEAQRILLPNPTKDLHWSDFRGAIHDIFASNAERHPERLCVVETASGSLPQREFTYKQINETSNVLAHHLVQSGVQRGEIVMIYAYRGVDLVIAVIGALKAGATFSVIDPLYPPDRQIIYLKVAQPRALINLAKATQEAGELSDKVRSFIRDTLDLRTEIPALAIRDDGSLLGGSVEGKDVLEQQQELKAKASGIIIGPDDAPTLSFTSGSEGNPKGVKGKTSGDKYEIYSWTAQSLFNLGENDRITMLSGIAHDPIQRDIFTPLFLGALLLVPSKEDIQNEKLAEWMQKYGATVTHLTPAMGQILVGNATAEFPKLHHAFYVGDILIKRDCKSMQRLAPNVRVVNMYGTTETQRAVSYYEIPSFNDDPIFLENMKDVIPAGKGMSEDVQLLVVNRTDLNKLCGIGEVGEIYVRAGGLAEGYLGQVELTEQKFKKNWFVDPQIWLDDFKRRYATTKQEPWRQYYQGPRDRLYKSGDLGRYTPSGQVECSGRADDQVKIRGFRVELGEIDTHLSKHPLVRENVTLVRRDKYEEKNLVSYIVPQMKAWTAWLETRRMEDEPGAEGMVGLLRRFRPLRDDVREHLKLKLPAYAVPSIIIPLQRMPLNPNGKIDKPALPFPDISDISAAAPKKSSISASGMTSTEKTLALMWARLLRLDADMISVDDSFFDLGGDSIKGNRMVFEVRKTWRVEVSMNVIFRSPTLADFALSIDKLRDPDAFEVSIDNQQGMEGIETSNVELGDDYGIDAKRLEKTLPQSFLTAKKLDLSRPITVFLTGATGFLGSYIIRDLLSRETPINIVAHVRGKSTESAMLRVQETCKAYGVWNTDWASRIRCVTGNLGDPKLGLADGVWEELNRSVDIVIHNGALVHWVYPYSKLKGPNVQGTLDALEFCAIGRPKTFVFVSSTAVLDHGHYVQLSDRLRADGEAGIPESDDLKGSSTGLGIGYGQVKWVSEYLTREAGRRGLRGAIVRPGYVSGDSQTGVTNTDDFLVRMLKGCIQLSTHPDINNTINMCPVDFVSRLIVAASLHSQDSLTVMQCTSHPRLRFNEYLGMLKDFGYDVPKVDYIPWRVSLERYVAQDNEKSETQHALLPLYHFVTADLPSSTKSPELDDTRATAALQADSQSTGQDFSRRSGVGTKIMGRYLAYLIAVGFLPQPPLRKKERDVEGEQERVELKAFTFGEGQKEALGKVGGRGGMI